MERSSLRRNDGSEMPKSRKSIIKPWHIALTLGGLAAMLAVTTALVGFVQLVLHRARDTEEFAVAYACFVQSRTWQEMDAEESQIRLNRYSLSTDYSQDPEEPTKTAQIGFMVEGRFFRVVCVWEDDAWRVLETDFD